MTQVLGDPIRHFWMTRSVARVMGLSLSDALQTGELGADDYADMVTACRGCALVEACEEWLSSRSGGSTTAPPGCCISGILAHLKQLENLH